MRKKRRIPEQEWLIPCPVDKIEYRLHALATDLKTVVTVAPSRMRKTPGHPFSKAAAAEVPLPPLARLKTAVATLLPKKPRQCRHVIDEADHFFDFGTEERDIIAPAIAAAVWEGIDAHGPYAPDTVFMRARRGEFDLAAMVTRRYALEELNDGIAALSKGEIEGRAIVEL